MEEGGEGKVEWGNLGIRIWEKKGEWGLGYRWDLALPRVERCNQWFFNAPPWSIFWLKEDGDDDGSKEMGKWVPEPSEPIWLSQCCIVFWAFQFAKKKKKFSLHGPPIFYIRMFFKINFRNVSLQKSDSSLLITLWNLSYDVTFSL